jgi:hypothetical protein
MCVLIEDVRLLPSALILPIPLVGGEVEIVLEYEGIPSQCSKCLGLDHETEKCSKTKPKMQKNRVGGQKMNQPTVKQDYSQKIPNAQHPSRNVQNSRSPVDEGSSQSGSRKLGKHIAGSWPKLPNQKCQHTIW